MSFKNSLIVVLLYSNWALGSDKTFQIESEILEIQTKIEQLRLDQKKTETHLNDLNVSLKNKQKSFILKIKDLEKVRKFPWIRLFVESSDPARIERNTRIYSILSKSDIQAASEMAALKKQIEFASKKLNEELKNLESVLEKEYARLDQALVQSEGEDLIFFQKNNTVSLLQQKGKLTLPVLGKIKTLFGNTIDPTGQYLFASKGLVIASAPLTPARPISRGEVIFRDVIPWWEETLIIRHDGDYYSVYAGLTKVSVPVGQKVSENEIIGYTKDSDFYFELRHFQNAINPIKWFQEDQK